MITADGAGSNGSRLRLWKRELQRLATELGIDITISHFLPGTIQVEQDQAPPVLVHQSNLARHTAGQSIP
jgi:hypothetical protein